MCVDCVLDYFIIVFVSCVRAQCARLFNRKGVWPLVGLTCVCVCMLISVWCSGGRGARGPPNQQRATISPDRTEGVRFNCDWNCANLRALEMDCCTFEFTQFIIVSVRWGTESETEKQSTQYPCAEGLAVVITANVCVCLSVSLHTLCRSHA